METSTWTNLVAGIAGLLALLVFALACSSNRAYFKEVDREEVSRSWVRTGWNLKVVHHPTGEDSRLSIKLLVTETLQKKERVTEERVTYEHDDITGSTSNRRSTGQTRTKVISSEADSRSVPGKSEQIVFDFPDHDPITALTNASGIARTPVPAGANECKVTHKRSGRSVRWKRPGSGTGTGTTAVSTPRCEPCIGQGVITEIDQEKTRQRNDGQIYLVTLTCPDCRGSGRPSQSHTASPEREEAPGSTAGSYRPKTGVWRSSNYDDGAYGMAEELMGIWNPEGLGDFVKELNFRTSLDAIAPGSSRSFQKVFAGQNFLMHVETLEAKFKPPLKNNKQHIVVVEIRVSD